MESSTPKGDNPETTAKTDEVFTYTLKDGRIAKILPGKGKHAVKASEMCDGKQSLWLPALLSQLCTLDSKRVTMEDFLELDLKDYMKLSAEVGGNFI